MSHAETFPAPYGDAQIAVGGLEADTAYEKAVDTKRPRQWSVAESWITVDFEDAHAALTSRRGDLDPKDPARHRARTEAEPPWLRYLKARRPADMLDRYRHDAGLSHGDLWLRYFALGR